MAKGDTKTNQYLDIAANGTRSDFPASCCETRSQTLIREVGERIMDLEDEVERLENNPDVVDIVATYVDLQSYDTSQLTDKDVIRVLQDETHDGDSTYYRWSTSTNTWTYIGESKQYTDFVGTDGTEAGEAGLVPAPATTDAGKFLKADGTWDTAGGGDTVYSSVTTSNSSTGGAVYIGNLNSSQVEQTDPTATDAHRKYFWALPYANNITPGSNSINILGEVTGNNLSGVISLRGGDVTSSNTVAIGSQYTRAGESVAIGDGSVIDSNGSGGVALGYGAKVSALGGVALGCQSASTRAGEVNIGSRNSSYGYNSSNYRLISGVYDGQSAHDVVTVGQVNSVIDAINTALSTNIPHIGA